MGLCEQAKMAISIKVIENPCDFYTMVEDNGIIYFTDEKGFKAFLFNTIRFTTHHLRTSWSEFIK